MNPQEEKDILTYLEGEIKCTEGGIFIMINEDFLCSISFPVSDKVSINDMQKFIAEAIINERERRREQKPTAKDFSKNAHSQILDLLSKVARVYYQKGKEENGGMTIAGDPLFHVRSQVLDYFGNEIHHLKSLITPKKEE